MLTDLMDYCTSSDSTSDGSNEPNTIKLISHQMPSAVTILYIGALENPNTSARTFAYRTHKLQILN